MTGGVDAAAVEHGEGRLSLEESADVRVLFHVKGKEQESVGDGSDVE